MLKCLGADRAEMAVLGGSIVEDLDIVEDVGLGEFAGFVNALAHALPGAGTISALD
jgi:hypothetical protein